MRIRQAVILAGGQGTRLRPLTLTTAKPMIPFHGKPFAHYLVDLLKKNGIEEIIFLTGYLGEQFPAYFGDGSTFGLNIKYNDTPLEDDTGTRVKKARHLFDERFLLMYGDNYWPLDLPALAAFHEKRKVPLTVTVYERPHSEAKKNNMRVDAEGFVTTYDKKRETPGLNGVDIGFFIVEKEALNLLPESNSLFETNVMWPLIPKHKLGGFLSKHPYWGLTDAERLPGVARALDPARKVAFLDRDGTINRRPPKAEYVKNWGEFEFLPGSIDGMKMLSEAGYELYVISNQSGIARGMVTPEALEDIHSHMKTELAKHGITIQDIYFCPHGWDEGCPCRKPAPGMLYQAAREHDIDLTRAILIGDDERDIEAGRAGGCASTYLVSEEETLFSVAKQLASQAA